MVDSFRREGGGYRLTNFRTTCRSPIVNVSKYIPAASSGTDSLMRYRTNALSNHITDFSHVGYRNGEVELPELPVEMTISPVEGDNTSHIQNALETDCEQLKMEVTDPVRFVLRPRRYQEPMVIPRPDQQKLCRQRALHRLHRHRQQAGQHPAIPPVAYPI